VFQDDSSLIRRAKKGDPTAFETIYDRCHSPIYTFVFYRVGHAAVAEDITSEVFVRLVSKIDTFSEQGRPILAWLYTIARNLVTDYHRKSGQVTWLPLEEDLAAGKENSPTRVVERRLTQECLAAALEHLTEAQRQVILLKFFHGYSNADVGAILNKTEGAIKSLQNRALAALNRALDEEKCYEF